MKNVLITFLSMVVAFSCRAEGNDVQHRLESLLKNPSGETLENWKDASGTGLSDCTQNGGFTNETRAKLYALISNGDTYAFQAGLLGFSCWDGGGLGDFYRSAGQFFDRQPEEFMNLVINYRVDDYPLERMISMQPLELVDNFDGQLELIKKRIALLQRIKGSDVQPLIKSLEESKSRLELTIKEMQ